MEVVLVCAVEFSTKREISYTICQKTIKDRADRYWQKVLILDYGNIVNSLEHQPGDCSSGRCPGSPGPIQAILLLPVKERAGADIFLRQFAGFAAKTGGGSLPRNIANLA
jgi:hypothetical protein